jgi:hypothetical protein
VTALSSIPQEALAQAETKIIVVGCGEWQPIQHLHGESLALRLFAQLTYGLPVSQPTESTNFHGEVYADPSRKLYHALGMTTETLAVAPAGTPRKSYLHTSRLANALRSIWVRLVQNFFCPLLILFLGKFMHVSRGAHYKTLRSLINKGTSRNSVVNTSWDQVRLSLPFHTFCTIPLLISSTPSIRQPMQFCLPHATHRRPCVSPNSLLPNMILNTN